MFRQSYIPRYCKSTINKRLYDMEYSILIEFSQSFPFFLLLLDSYVTGGSARCVSVTFVFRTGWSSVEYIA